MCVCTYAWLYHALPPQKVLLGAQKIVSSELNTSCVGGPFTLKTPAAAAVVLVTWEDLFFFVR